MKTKNILWLLRVLTAGVMVVGFSYEAFSAANGKVFKIVAFGDSTTAPRDGVIVYSDQIKEILRAASIPFEIVNKGVGGENTRDASARFEADVLKENPDVVIIQFGINDSAFDVWKSPPAKAPRISLQEYEKNIRYFVNALKARGVAVILMTPNQMRWTEKLKRMYGRNPYNPDDERGFIIELSKYSNVIRKIGESENVAVVDVFELYDKWEVERGMNASNLLIDGIHPNTEGQSLVAKSLAPVIISIKSKLQ